MAIENTSADFYSSKFIVTDILPGITDSVALGIRNLRL